MVSSVIKTMLCSAGLAERRRHQRGVAQSSVIFQAVGCLPLLRQAFYPMLV